MALDMGKSIGPLPLGAWVAVVGGGLLVAWYSSSKSSTKSTSDSSSDDTTDDSTDDSENNEDGLRYVSVYTDDTSEDDNPTTNEEWSRIAIDGLTAKGYPAATVNSAITKALMGGTDYSGSKMSVQEWSIWQLALMYYGTPPQPVNVPPPTDTPGPVTPPTNPPTTSTPPSTEPSTKTPKHYTYTVVRGDTLSGITSKTNKKYGLHNSWETVWNFNLKYRSASTIAVLKARGPNKIYAGQTIWIPNTK